MFDLLPSLSYSMSIVVMLVGGILLLRIAGKKSISQLTVTEAVIIIALGTLLILPISPKTVWGAIYGGFILAGGLIVISYLQIWFPFLRKWFTGTPSIIIRNGTIDLKVLKKNKMTTDELEMRLRQLQVSAISEVKIGVLEPSGILSIIQEEPKKAAQKEDIQLILDEIHSIKTAIHTLMNKDTLTSGQAINVEQSSKDPLFEDALQENSPVKYH